MRANGWKAAKPGGSMDNVIYARLEWHEALNLAIKAIDEGEGISIDHNRFGYIVTVGDNNPEADSPDAE